MRHRQRGFTLLELVIALCFSTIVLYGITSIFTSMTKFQFEAVRKSSVDIWSQATLAQMTKEIEDATILYFPNTANVYTTAIMGCSNWSAELNGMPGNPGAAGALNPNDYLQSPVVWFYYCYDTTSGPTVPPSTTPVAYLRRLSATQITAGGVPSCPGVGVTPASYPCTPSYTLPGAGKKTNDVIATEVNLLPGYHMFTYNNTDPATGVNMNFIVGNPSAGTPTGGESGEQSAANITNPQTMVVQTSITLNRPYLNSND
ncbi:MAG: type II secretion system protein [Elusimicrobia bacterium]|nr:type II secretion system protein [Elusimicrobiota bacterium]